MSLRYYSKDINFSVESPSYSQNPSHFIANRSNSIETPSFVGALLNNLESKFSEFDKVVFPLLQLPGSKPRQKHKKKLKNKKTEKTINSKLSHLKIPKIPEIHPPVVLPTIIHESIRHNLGPGKYNIYEDRNIPGNFYSATPRFHSKSIELAELIISKHKKCDTLHDIIEENKNTNRFIRENKLRENTEIAKLRELNKKLHLKTKEILVNETKDKKQENYNQKISNFEWRIKKEEINKIKQGWGSLIVMISSLYQLNKRLTHRKDSIKRIEQSLSVLFFASVFIGKMLITLKKIRWRFLVRVLTKHSHYAKIWVKKQRESYKNKIQNYIEKHSVFIIMNQAAKCFNNKLVFMQTKLRRLLKVKRARLWCLNYLFKKLETKLFNTADKKIPKNYSVSYEIIDKEIRSYYKDTLKSYVASMKEYKKKIKIIKKTAWKYYSKPQEKPKPPIKPMLKLYTNHQEVQKRIRPLFFPNFNIKPTKPNQIKKSPERNAKL